MKKFKSLLVLAAIAVLTACNSERITPETPEPVEVSIGVKAPLETVARAFVWTCGATMELNVTPNSWSGRKNRTFIIFDRPDSCAFCVATVLTVEEGGIYKGDMSWQPVDYFDATTFALRSDVTRAAYRIEDDVIYLDNGYEFTDTRTGDTYTGALYNSLDTGDGRREYHFISKIEVVEGQMCAYSSDAFWNADRPHSGIMYYRPLAAGKI